MCAPRTRFLAANENVVMEFELENIRENENLDLGELEMNAALGLLMLRNAIPARDEESMNVENVPEPSPPMEVPTTSDEPFLDKHDQNL